MRLMFYRFRFALLVNIFVIFLHPRGKYIPIRVNENKNCVVYPNILLFNQFESQTPSAIVPIVADDFERAYLGGVAHVSAGAGA